MTIGYTHGRFQPLHNGHFNTMKFILKNYDELWIGIANPLREYPKLLDESDMKLVKSIKEARTPSKNLFTYLQRSEMITTSLVNIKVDLSRVRILPHFAFYDAVNWIDFLPPKNKSKIVLAAKDYHHYMKKDKYLELGWNLEFIDLLEGISSTKFIAEFPDGEWQKLVPVGISSLIEEHSTSE